MSKLKKMVENIAYEHGLCSCDEMYTRRGLTAPDCPWHAYAVEEAMKAFAQAVAEDALKRAADENKDVAIDAYECIMSTPINTDI